ncbi:MAG: EAL domain-containing protein [Proteobacteria bacterium]|nr:EAL domain-containing protein [Pseudomonadota bacterium]
MRLASLLHGLDLKARIAIFTVALFVCAIWLLAHDLDAEVRGNFKEVLAVQQFQTAEHLASSLDEAIRLRINALADAATLIDPEWMNRPDRLHDYLAERMPLYRFFNTGIFIVSPEGIGLADLPNLGGREGASYAQRDFFREVMATGKPVVGKPILGRFTHQPVINIAVPIRNRSNEVIGVLVGGNQIAGGDLLGTITPKKLHLNGELHVISARDGMFITSTDSSRILQPEPAAGVDKMYDRYKQGYEGSGVAINSQGIDTLSSAKRVPSTGWLVIAALPTAVVFEPIAALEYEIYQDAAMSSLVIALLLWLFLYRQLRPLTRSAQLIDAMSNGHSPLRPLPVDGSKEIRRLLSSFNQLQQHIQEQKQSLRESAEQMRLAASVFEGTSEAVLISSADNVILSVNRAFCQMTGYDKDELIGGNPRLLQSGRHRPAYYQKMWAKLLNTGQWQGEIWNRRKNGEIYPERLNIAALYDDSGKVLRYIAIAADITKQKQADALIWQQANYNLLTSLPNRHLMRKRIQETLEKSQRDGSLFAVLLIDLDHFMEVNNTLGHGVGDQMIVETARRIAACVGSGSSADADTVAHLGGDEFTVVLGDLADSSPRVEQVAGEILRTIAEPFRLDRETAYISASIGITLFRGDGEDVSDLLKKADQAMHAAKDQGRNRYCYFSDSMQLAAQTRMQLATDMRGALAASQFEVYYQPIVDLATGSVVKAEALLRWHHPERGMVSPVEFIPIAEEIGLISEIGDWVFKEAAQLAKRWCSCCRFSLEGVCVKAESSEAASACPRQITVNKSPRQFFTGNTDKTWTDYLREHNIYSSCITIEITEGLLLDKNPEVMEKFNVFRDAGIQVALDDFGTGYSAMSYLKKFDIDYLKIDRSFVSDIVTDASDRAIAEAIIAMAHKLGLKVVAEGVETPDQRDLLAAAGCNYGQGYLFAKPMPAAQFEGLVAAASGGKIQGIDSPHTV